MLVSLIAKDRNEVQADANVSRNQSWVSIRLARKGGDFAIVYLAISVDAARELAAQLPKAINDAERFVAQPTADASDA